MMGQILQPGANASANAYERAESWEKSWPEEPRPSASGAVMAWWSATDEAHTLLQRLALAHLLVGVCVAVGLGWQTLSASGQAGQALTPAIGLLVAVGGALALLLVRLGYPAAPLLARLALVAVDLSAAGGILWLRGGEGWTLLILLPPIALAVAFFAERGGALATLLAALMIVAVNASVGAPTSGWMPSLLVFLGVAALIVAFLGIYSAQITETSANLRWLLADAQAINERLHTERQSLLVRLRSAEQARETLLRERAQLGDIAAELALMTQRMAQGDPSATQALQSLHPGACGPLAELASALTRLAHAPVGGGHPSAMTTLDIPLRAQGQALESLDLMARSLCVGANELVMEAQTLEPGVSLIGSGQYTQALWQLEEHLRGQAAHMALLGTQLADIRTTQENVEALLVRTAAGAKTPTIFANSDIRDIRSVSQYSGPQVTFGSSAIRRAAQQSQQGDNGTVRWGNWQNQSPLAYNRGV
jgi:hypothetical protein